MTEYPPVIILLVTYRRLNLALETIRSVKSRLIYPNIGFHIADDGSGAEYVHRLREEIGPTYAVTLTDARRGGVGKSMNMGIAECLQRASLWFHLEDDWVLPQSLDLSPCVDLLTTNKDIGMVRLGRLSTGVQGEVISGASNLWWQLKRNTDPYIFNGNPSLRHRRFHDAYGPYKEGLLPGETELTYCWRFNNSKGPGIVYPAWLTPEQTFQHIGDHQSYKWWLETGGKTAEEAAAMFEAMDRATA